MNSKTKILLVDDEPDIVEFLKYNLEKKEFKVECAFNGTEAIQKASSFHPHVIILDLNMPEMDGIETCRRLKESNLLESTLVSFLTARTEEYTEIAALDAGADGFMTKPIKMRLFESRLKCLLRRHPLFFKSNKNHEIQIRDLKISKDQFEVHKHEQLIPLSKKEFNILYLLASKPGFVFQREVIYQKIWGQNIMVNDRTLDVHISKLREKLGKKYIKTIKGVGYKFRL